MEKLIELYNKVNKFGSANNMVLEIIKPGEIRYTMKIEEQHLATPHAAHGGIIAAFMDGILGVSALSFVAADNKLVSTVEFKIHYFNPALLHDELVGTGKVEHAGKRIIVSSGEIHSSTHNRIVAKALGTFNAYPFEKSGIEL